MFTGIIAGLGRVQAIARDRKGARLQIITSYPAGSIRKGDSICCSGACMTVIEKGKGWFAVYASEETLSCTTLGNWKANDPVNLERSLRVGGQLGGHIVSGHVDGVASLESAADEGLSLRLTFKAPEKLEYFIAPKGSVAIDGVSLTVNEVNGALFGVNVIPFTREHTTLGRLAPGGLANLEIDMLARYVARLLEGK